MKWKNLFQLLVLCCLCFSLAPPVYSDSISRTSVPHILILNSYNYGYDWSDKELAGIRRVFEGTFPRFELLVENLDTKKFYHKTHFPYLADLFRNKYSQRRPDIVIAMDNAALEFATKYRQQLFPGVPLVFCGINDYTPEMISGLSGATGVAEIHDSVGTLALALELQPAIKEVVVLHDYTDTGLAMRHELESSEALFPHLKFRYLPEAPLETTVSSLKKLTRNQIVLVLSYTVEKGGRTFSQSEIGQLVSANSPVPVYAVHAAQLRHGVLGGMMIDGTDQGRRAAEIAIKVLTGVAPEKIPVVTNNLSHPMFDDQVLQKYHLDATSLPGDTIYTNLPQSFYSVNKKAFWLLLGIIAFLALSLVIIVRNNRQRKQAEENLRESEKRFRMLVEQAPEAILVHDIERNRFVDCNANAIKLFGCSREEILRLGPYHFSAKNPSDQTNGEERVQDHIDRAIAGEEVRFEQLIENARNEKLYCEVCLVNFPSKKQKLLRVSYVDITEKREMESRLNQADKMRVVGQLAGGVAHDFNNQLAGILANTELLLAKLDAEKLKKYAQSIKTSANQSADLTRKLLAFCHKSQLPQTPVDLHETINEVVTVLSHSIDKRIKIRQTLHADPATITGDSTLLQNALLNIAINARDAMPDGGELAFKTEIVFLDPASLQQFNQQPLPGKYVNISVADNGCGIPKEIQAHIFEPFYTTKEVGKGTGMGLASVYGTVMSHKGAINVYSEVGQGTIFRIYLPLAENLLNDHETQVLETPVKGEGRVLIVDDEEVLRNTGTELLQELGYQVTACMDGKEAVNYYQTHWKEIDLVIFDLVMPKMDGQETYAALRKINPDVRTILLSGHIHNEKAQALRADGVSALLSKPFNYIEFSKKIAQVLGRERSPEGA